MAFLAKPRTYADLGFDESPSLLQFILEVAEREEPLLAGKLEALAVHVDSLQGRKGKWLMSSRKNVPPQGQFRPED